MTGHSSGTVGSTYGKGASIKTLKAAIEKIRFAELMRCRLGGRREAAREVMKRHHSLSILWRRGSPCQMQGPPVNRFKQPHNKELRGLCLLPDAQTPLVSPQDPLQQPHLALRIARRYGWTSEGAIGASEGSL